VSKILIFVVNLNCAVIFNHVSIKVVLLCAHASQALKVGVRVTNIAT
jgi:hypothetical protein